MHTYLSMNQEDQTLDLASVDPIAALEVAETALRLLQSDANLLTWSIRFVPSMHFSAYQIAQETGQRKRARDHLVRALQFFQLLQGSAAPETLRTQQLLETFR